jgi:hypothetical protein
LEYSAPPREAALLVNVECVMGRVVRVEEERKRAAP